MTTRREALAALLALASAAATSGGAARPGQLEEEEEAPVSPNRDARLRWFLDAKLGLFLHWGPYSIAGVEASWPIMAPAMVRTIGPHQRISEADYVALAERFDPDAFDPGAWVDLAQRAGMRYAVITAKHHDGYCLFDAPGTDYKITRSPYGRDLLAELAEACAVRSFPLGVYYSPPDMHHPGYRDTSLPAKENWWGEPDRPQWADYLDTMEAHLRKLLTDYGHIAVLWFDGLFRHQQYDPPRFHRLVRELSPTTLVNDRLGAALGDYVTPEQTAPDGIPVRSASPRPGPTLDQFRQFLELIESGQLTSEQIAALFELGQKSRLETEPLPPLDRFQPWETCLTIGRTWAFDPHETDYKSADALIGTLIDVASRGGNLLLNVGPRPDGTLPPPCVDRLRAIGAFLDRFGDSIWATTYGPYQGRDDLRSTQNAHSIYLHLPRSTAGLLELEAPPTPIAGVRRMSENAVDWQSADPGAKLVLRLPPASGRDVVELVKEAR